jgi:NADPH:quinone reductase
LRAIRVTEFGGPEKMRLEEVPDLQPGRGEIVVAIRAAGVNPVDTYIRSGVHARKPALPFTPGLDGAGTVLRLGEGVSGFSVGDRVYVGDSLSGTYAEQALCEVGQVHKLPENIDFSEGATIGIAYATAQYALIDVAQARSGETLLVHGGSGGVGTASVQIGKAHGMKVIATAGSERGLKLLREQGADHVVNHNGATYQDEIMAYTGGRGVDVIMEMLANKNLGNDLRLLARHGRVAIIGSRGTVEVNPRDAMLRNAAILGVFLFIVEPEKMAEIHSGLYPRLRDGTLKPIVGERMPLSDAIRAHVKVLEPGAYGKIVLTT